MKSVKHNIDCFQYFLLFASQELQRRKVGQVDQLQNQKQLDSKATFLRGSATKNFFLALVLLRC